MITIDSVSALALSLPDTSEGEYHGRRTWDVAGRTFAWVRPFSKADMRRFGDEPVPDGPIIAIRVADLGDKEAVLQAGAKGVFTIEHFVNYAAVLVHLRVATRTTLRHLLVDAWLAAAPPELSARYSVTALRRSTRA